MKRSSLLQDVGKLIFGKDWKQEMSEDLGVSREVIEKWLDGQECIPVEIPGKLIYIAKNKITEIYFIVDRLRAISNSR